MTLGPSLVLYFLFGAAVAVAMFLRDESRDSSAGFRVLTAWVFWPLYVPVLLSGADGSARGVAAPESASAPPRDELSDAIARVEAELDRALMSLDGWAGQALSFEMSRIDELKQAWRAQAARIRELSELLASAEMEDGAAPVSETALPDVAEVHSADSRPPLAGRYRQSEEARRENMERLRALRRRMHDDLLGTLAWVRELVTMIHLARYTGAPASRAEELVAQIAAAVEGLSEVSDWHNAPVPAA
jgi:hypothetical protein